MNAQDPSIVAVLLLCLLWFVLSAGVGMVCLANRWRMRQQMDVNATHRERWENPVSLPPNSPASILGRPACWLAIRSGDPDAVQSALALTNPHPCCCADGFLETGQNRLFVSPPIQGWTLVIGRGLPLPSEDPELFFHWVRSLSRKTGLVQFFEANRVLHHHAWGLAHAGQIIRAYAWAGETIWNQGYATPSERRLKLKTYDYGEAPEFDGFGVPASIMENGEKVPRLAALWSIDPSTIDARVWQEQTGISGESSGACLY